MALHSAARLARVFFHAACVVLLLAQAARSQTCELKLLVVSAKGLKHDDTFADKVPDAFVRVKQNGNQVCETGTKWSSADPVWDHQCPTLGNVQLGKAALAFEVLDDEVISAHDWMASTRTAVTLPGSFMCAQGFNTVSITSFKVATDPKSDVEALTFKYCYDCPFYCEVTGQYYVCPTIWPLCVLQQLQVRHRRVPDRHLRRPHQRQHHQMYTV